MKKIKSLKNFVILQSNEKERKNFNASNFLIFTKQEYFYREGFRSPEWETDSLDEAIEFINNFRKGDVY